MDDLLTNLEDAIFDCNEPAKLRHVSHLLQCLSNMAYADARHLETKDGHYKQVSESCATNFGDMMTKFIRNYNHG